VSDDTAIIPPCLRPVYVGNIEYNYLDISAARRPVYIVSNYSKTLKQKKEIFRESKKQEVKIMHDGCINVKDATRNL